MKKLVLLLLLFSMACRPGPGTVQLSVNTTNGTVRLTGLDQTTLQGIRRDSMPLAAWQSLFPVGVMPADSTMRNDQPPLPGQYRIMGKALVFIPKAPFNPGQRYFARYYHYDKPISMADIVLHRRVMGRSTYTELIFKY